MQLFFRYLALIFLLAMSQFAFATSANESSFNFVSMTDIHFNPYDSCSNASPCPLIDELRQAPIKEWDAILIQNQLSPNNYGTDTNYPLFKQSLTNAAKKVTEKTHFVVILGDLLSHDFDTHFSQYSSDKSTEAYKAFVKKTMEFVANKIKQAFPQQDVFVAIGNNDSDLGDNTYDPSHQFYRETAIIWGHLINNNQARNNMQKSFATAGYYAVDVPQQRNLRLIVLNTILFANKSQGDGIDQAAQDELNWLDQELSAHPQKTLIIMHIPVGVDVYATLKAGEVSPIELWKPQYTKEFLAQLHRHANHVVGLLAGHFHMDSFQVISNGKNNEIPVIGVPAVSPIFGNNPSFKILTYASKSLTLQDYATYYTSIADKGDWKQEYDFNTVYQPSCNYCRVVDGMNQLQKTGVTANRYQQYFSVGTSSQLITKAQKWLPYYWCAIHAITGNDYQNCVNSQ